MCGFAGDYYYTVHIIINLETKYRVIRVFFFVLLWSFFLLIFRLPNFAIVFFFFFYLFIPFYKYYHLIFFIGHFYFFCFVTFVVSILRVLEIIIRVFNYNYLCIFFFFDSGASVPD